MKRKTITIGKSLKDQLEDLKKDFVLIAPAVTPSMIAEVQIEMLRSEDTIKRYLSGKVGNLQVGLRMFDLLSNKIAPTKRKKTVAA